MKGVYETKKKDGTVYYRSSITFRNKHISLGSYASSEDAGQAYLEAAQILSGSVTVGDYADDGALSFQKAVTLINFRDNDVYIKNPIYLMKRYFLYYCDPETVFKFDIDDLFFYSSHHISRRGGHFFVADYGMQININTRYGIRRHAVLNRDYRFINGDRFDYRYENIDIINRYFGVEKRVKHGITEYRAKILVNGSMIIGTYRTELEAAIAYNKAADLITKQLPDKNYEINYIEGIPPHTYADIYTQVKISDKIVNYSS
ncbi:MAG: hypothetical protein K6G83_00475 [Lachnospiraceae bacterium]|nr:hypothetical protein [Lachnospiraceae bacterium]